MLLLKVRSSLSSATVICESMVPVHNFRTMVLAKTLRNRRYTASLLHHSEHVWHHALHRYESLGVMRLFKNIIRFFLVLYQFAVLDETNSSAAYTMFNFITSYMKFITTDPHSKVFEVFDNRFSVSLLSRIYPLYF